MKAVKFRHLEITDRNPGSVRIAPYVCVDDGQERIAYVFASNADMENLGDAEQRANRIVACVNACSGMADPAADLAALREALQAALASLESFTAHIETCDLEDSDLQALCKARKALADTERRSA